MSLKLPAVRRARSRSRNGDRGAVGIRKTLVLYRISARKSDAQPHLLKCSGGRFFLRYVWLKCQGPRKSPLSSKLFARSRGASLARSSFTRNFTGHAPYVRGILLRLSRQAAALFYSILSISSRQSSEPNQKSCRWYNSQCHKPQKTKHRLLFSSILYSILPLRGVHTVQAADGIRPSTVSAQQQLVRLGIAAAARRTPFAVGALVRLALER